MTAGEDGEPGGDGVLAGGQLVPGSLEGLSGRRARRTRSPAAAQAPAASRALSDRNP